MLFNSSGKMKIIGDYDCKIKLDERKFLKI